MHPGKSHPGLFFARLLILATAALSATPTVTAASARPNILVILTDDQGRGDYSGFGTKDIRTPNIDRVFREGMTFQNFFANSCVCSPTRAALLSGKYPDRVGVPGVIREAPSLNSCGWLSPDVKLLPQLLKSAGYHCALIGKWHLGASSPNLPNDRGFDYFHGFLSGMMDYWTHRQGNQNFMRHNREVIDPNGHATDLFTKWASDYLEARAQTDQPFFLYLAYNAPHAPIQPPPDWLAKVKQREPQLSDKRAKLVALIEHLDAGLGKVLNVLDRTGLAENTLVIFCSDNGGLLADGANNGPWREGKGHVYEGGLRVVGAARWPGVIAPRTQTPRMTLSMDIFATLCSVAGVSTPADTDGHSFLPTLRGEHEPAIPRDFYFVRREGGPGYWGKTIEAIRRGKWKLLQDSPFGPRELYDLEADPGETTNLATQEPKVFRELSASLQQSIQRGGVTPWQPTEESNTFSVCDTISP